MSIMKTLYVFIISESTMERIKMIENTIKKICSILVLCVFVLLTGLVCLIFFEFFPDIFNSRN